MLGLVQEGMMQFPRAGSLWSEKEKSERVSGTEASSGLGEAQTYDLAGLRGPPRRKASQADSVSA